MGHALRESLIEQDAVDLAVIQQGVEVELTGYLDKGLFAPVILPTEIRILGKQELPPAKRAVMRRFFSGADDVRRININGIVQGITSEGDSRWLLRVESGAGHFLVRLPKTDAYAPHRLLDAEIQFTGLAAVSRNWRSELDCPRLIIERHEDVVIVTPASPDPFAVEKVSLDTLDERNAQGWRSGLRHQNRVPQELMSAIVAIRRGEHYVSPEVARCLKASLPPRTADGTRNRSIAVSSQRDEQSRYWVDPGNYHANGQGTRSRNPAKNARPRPR